MILVMASPSAGGHDASLHQAVCEELRRLDEVRSLRPRDGSGAAEVLDAAADASVVVVVGGDGSLNHAINALEPRLGDLTFGLVPAGTGNDFARTAGLPGEPAEAARVVAGGTPRSFDVARAGGEGVSRLFVNACMGGFPVRVDEAIDDSTKEKLGPLAFWVGGAKAAVGIERSTVTIDGVELADCVAAGVGNARTCGGGIPVWPGADPSDGKLDGCALAAPNVAAAIRLLAKVRSGDHAGLDDVRTTTGARITIDADPPIEFNVDGELVGLTSPATFEVCGTFRLIT